MAFPCKNEIIVLGEAHSADIKLGSDVTVLCPLPSEINAADVDIRWFKGTDCLCVYIEEQTIAGVGYKGRVKLIMEMERGNISLELKDFRESDVGDYLCQVVSGGRTEKKTVRLYTAFLLPETTPEQNDEIKMEKSVLMAVITELKDTKQECKKKDAEIEELKAECLQTAEELKKRNTQQENMHNPAKELNTNELHQDNLESKTTSLEKQQNIEVLKVFTHFCGTANALHKVHQTFIDTLGKKNLNLSKVDTLDESEVFMIFCLVSQMETEIDGALKRFEGESGSKLAVLVVLYPMTGPEKPVLDNSKYINRTDILTVDCLFNEDTGLLKCQKNSDALDKVINCLKERVFNKRAKAGADVCPPQDPDQVGSHNSTKDEVESESVQREPKLKDASDGLEKTQQGNEEKNAPIEPVRAVQLQTSKEPEEENTQQKNMHKLSKELETSEVNQDPDTKSTPLEIQQLNIEEVKMFTLCTGNADALQKTQKEFIGILRNKIPNLREVHSLEESNLALIFCPNVSVAGLDIEAALKRFEDSRGSKPALLVVLHHTFDSEKVVLDSSRYVKRTDILTVDCLFNEDNGLLKCQKNSDAAHKAVTWLKQQDKSGSKPVQAKSQRKEGNKPKTKGVKMFCISAGNVDNCYQKFIGILENRFKSLSKVHTVDESDVILVFCPIVSRAGTDIDSALNKLKCHTDSEKTVQLKPTVLVVLHHTFDSEKVMPDSSQYVKRTDILTVDCLFNEDTGLLNCQKNLAVVQKVVNWLNLQVMKQETSADNMTQMTPTSSCALNYFVSVTGDAQEHHKHFINALQKRMQLRKVQRVQESDVILLFCPDIIEHGKKLDKPVVIISLSYTVDPINAKNISGFECRRSICPVDCIFVKGEGLLDCQINKEEMSAVLNFFKKKKVITEDEE
ncbi:uncharacterized protein LOC122345658 isoform X2 [Puntigrus tetrazona]|uniref:uncharacterized protein LOC122345658 isoform X2 n=1 Tax=Puntigrus tetrazona TaxID=1606681 RepID=UPI001C8A407D|nr:uncharacterized protein LOC122345658 isoform X2 [Puntigrus tetrazona]